VLLLFENSALQYRTVPLDLSLDITTLQINFPLGLSISKKSLADNIFFYYEILKAILIIDHSFIEEYIKIS
jgi:hypothetical protein